MPTHAEISLKVSMADRIKDRRIAWFEITGRCAVMYTAMVMCYFNLMPLWALFLINVVFYPGVYLMLHDLCHAWPVKKTGLVARFIPTANPVWGGVAVFRSTHFRHHKYLGTDQDPWLPYYGGHPLRALLCNYLEPEINLFNHIKQEGVSLELMFNLIFNLVVLGVNTVFFGGIYLAHVVFQRIVHGLGIFWFNFFSHRETMSADAPIGTWNREKEYAPFEPVMKLIWGRVVDGAIYHNRHHIISQVQQPVRNYPMLSDEGECTPYIRHWPVDSVRHLDIKTGGDRPMGL